MEIAALSEAVGKVGSDRTRGCGCRAARRGCGFQANLKISLFCKKAFFATLIICVFARKFS